MLELYKNIKKRREALHIKQNELAALLGYADKSMISKIENGHVDLTQSKISALAQILQVHPAVLMGWLPDEDELLKIPDSDKKPVRVPLCTGVIRETLCLSVDTYEYIHPFPGQESPDFFLIAENDIRADVHLKEGDLVYISQSAVPKAGDIAAVYESGKGIRLCRIVSDEKCPDQWILGKAVSFKSRL